MVTIADIKAMVAAGPGPVLNGPPLAEGQLHRFDGVDIPYGIHEGWNIQLANACDDQWGAFNIQLLEHLASQRDAGIDMTPIMEDVQLDDAHWRWLAKSVLYTTDEYRWFFLMAEGTPQGACLIYFPKDSAIDGQSIFYIEYIAAAPWNRQNPISERRFRGVGTILVDFAKEYGVHQLGLRLGYCLHALPKAVPFYESLGMLAFPERDKDDLPYFEMPPTTPPALGVASGL
ncbi:GNAT family N-acetyltransferase [Pseudoxanthomonas winnipegensis]|uniref:GNAT family N-acetyltransferase n=1 Tax=Pseudoxanthomonas winnipegensis TaxID=2480810 RepID=UPI00103C85C9|nr:GNAT family N-acetyltransferase [Pseudoxanthomonas winnipegensis]TBV72281.1 GNAT family N-acetyltransferase [Pseudoxanthomonas winnipegensis]